MGYTHYWTISKRIPAVKWILIQTAVEEIIKASPAKVQYEFDLDAAPQINGEAIRFNGPGDEGCETFILSRGKSEFEFCKTRQRPYDEVVVATLIAAKVFAPECVSASTDGTQEDWARGAELALSVLPDGLLGRVRVSDAGAITLVAPKVKVTA